MLSLRPDGCVWNLQCLHACMVSTGVVAISELSVVMDDVWNLQCLHACMVSRELWQLWQDNNVYLALLMTLMVTMPARVPWELCS